MCVCFTAFSFFRRKYTHVNKLLCTHSKYPIISSSFSLLFFCVCCMLFAVVALLLLLLLTLLLLLLLLFTSKTNVVSEKDVFVHILKVKCKYGYATNKNWNQLRWIASNAKCSMHANRTIAPSMANFLADQFRIERKLCKLFNLQHVQHRKNRSQRPVCLFCTASKYGWHTWKFRWLHHSKQILRSLGTRRRQWHRQQQQQHRHRPSRKTNITFEILNDGNPFQAHVTNNGNRWMRSNARQFYDGNWKSMHTYTSSHIPTHSYIHRSVPESKWNFDHNAMHMYGSIGNS